MAEIADTVVIGSGFTGMLVARELVEAGQEVIIVERGPMRLDADSLPLSQREERLASTEHNTRIPRRGVGVGFGSLRTPPVNEPVTTRSSPTVHRQPWTYAYAFGGSSLTWSGVAPRLLPTDFKTQSAFGFGRDWPISYDDLLPFYQEVERALAISGASHDLFPGSDTYPVPPPAPSAVDELLGSLLEPFAPLPLARQTADPADYPPPLEGSRESIERPSTMLEVARGLIASGRLTVRDRTVASRLRTANGRVSAVEFVSADGVRGELLTKRVVAGAHGIENAALLLRSGLDGPAVGRWLGAHTHVVLELELNQAVDHAHASTRESGISYAWTDGPWRSERASAIVVPFNPGLLLRDRITEALVDGRCGPKLRHELSRRFARTVVLYISLEDVPRDDRFVQLSSKRDSLGLPRTDVSYPPDSDYAIRGLHEVCNGLQERLRPLGARIVGHQASLRGGHMLGTCFMGSDGVVDENLRHHDIDNLYVAGGSAFPSYSSLHPTTTIAALAVRLGRHLAASSA